MKLMRISTIGVFLIAICCSFLANSKNPKPLYQTCNWRPALSPDQCNGGGVTDDNCHWSYSGSICTTYDPYAGVNVSAYYNTGAGYDCTLLLRHQF